jgi:hypothetical protein
VAATKRVSACAADGWRAQMSWIVSRGMSSSWQASRVSASADLGPPSAMLSSPKLAPGPGDRQRQLGAVGGAHHDLDPAGDHHDQGVAGITGGKHHLTAAERPQPGRRRHRFEISGRHRAKQAGLAQGASHVSCHSELLRAGRRTA